LAVQCAILHDIIEDTEITHEKLKLEFGQKVANGVLALTKDKNLETKNLQMEDSLNRILQQSNEIAMVKMADRISNLYDPPFYWNTEKIKNYKTEAQIIFDNLAGANTTLAKRLKIKIEEY